MIFSWSYLFKYFFYILLYCIFRSINAKHGLWWFLLLLSFLLWCNNWLADDFLLRFDLFLNLLHDPLNILRNQWTRLTFDLLDLIVVTLSQFFICWALGWFFGWLPNKRHLHDLFKENFVQYLIRKIFGLFLPLKLNKIDNYWSSNHYIRHGNRWLLGTQQKLIIHVTDVKHDILLFFDTYLLFNDWLGQGRQIVKSKVNLLIILFVAFGCCKFIIVVTCCFKQLFVDEVWHIRWLGLLNSQIQLACTTALRDGRRCHWGRIFFWWARYMIFDISCLLIYSLYYQNGLSSFAL